jgi:hypothetical protein
MATPKITPKIPRKSDTGILQKILVYSQGEHRLLGHGWVLYKGGIIGTPTLIDLNGNAMEEGWYTIAVTDESHLVIAPEGIY